MDEKVLAFGREMRRIQIQRMDMLKQVADAARMVVPVLHDKGMSATAKQIEEKLFQLDAIEGDANRLLTAEPSTYIKWLEIAFSKGV